MFLGGDMRLLSCQMTFVLYVCVTCAIGMSHPLWICVMCAKKHVSNMSIAHLCAICDRHVSSIMSSHIFIMDIRKEMCDVREMNMCDVRVVIDMCHPLWICVICAKDMSHSHAHWKLSKDISFEMSWQDISFQNDLSFQNDVSFVFWDVTRRLFCLLRRLSYASLFKMTSLFKKTSLLSFLPTSAQHIQHICWTFVAKWARLSDMLLRFVAYI